MTNRLSYGAAYPYKFISVHLPFHLLGKKRVLLLLLLQILDPKISTGAYLHLNHGSQWKNWVRTTHLDDTFIL
jgi:hypothetical protein